MSLPRRFNEASNNSLGTSGSGVSLRFDVDAGEGRSGGENSVLKNVSKFSTEHTYEKDDSGSSGLEESTSSISDSESTISTPSDDDHL